MNDIIIIVQHNKTAEIAIPLWYKFLSLHNNIICGKTSRFIYNVINFKILKVVLVATDIVEISR